MSESTRNPIPAREVRVEDVVSRSRFIATLAPAESVEAARGFIARVAAEFPDATHNCWAYLIGAPGSGDRVGMSDDGEPHGTAGRPMLNVLAHSGVGDVAVVVTRYFGGTKLGRGGLVRAYGTAVQAALDAAGTVQKIAWARALVRIEYPLLEPLKRLLPEYEAEISNEEFSDSVALNLRLPEERLPALEQRLADLSNGRVAIERLGD